MSKRKVCVVVTARPSYSRIKSALMAIQEHENLELQLVVAGTALLSKYGTAIQYIEEDGFEIKEKVFVTIEGENQTAMAKSTGLAVMEFANVFYNLNPDMVITIADRFETIATSIAAAYQNIPLVHIQGGEITGNIDEKVRHANTKMADIHLVATERARDYVIRLGEDEEFVFVTGCPSLDLANELLTDQTLGFDPVTKYGGVGGEFELPDEYLVVLQHPVTNESKLAKEHITETLDAIYQLKIPTYWFWPNVDAGADGTSNGIRTFRENQDPDFIRFFKNMDPHDFLRLLNCSACLIGNSSVGIRECSYLGVPVVNIGSRQNKRERAANVLDVEYNEQKIRDAIQVQIQHGRYTSSNLYGDGKAGKKIADTLSKIKLRYHKTLSY